MPLPKTRWIDNKNDKFIAFHALMLMLIFPITPIKIRTAQQIAELLQEPYIKTYKTPFLTFLSEQTLEADICACLVPLALSGNPPLISLQDVLFHISTPSILSDKMLEDIYHKSIQFHAWAKTPSILALPDFKASNEMLIVQKNDTLLYSRELEEWGIHTGLPLTQQFYWKWEQLWKKYDGQKFSFVYFNSKKLQEYVKCWGKTKTNGYIAISISSCSCISIRSIGRTY